MSRCQSTGGYSRNGRKESLLDRHGAPHESKMTREGADVLIGTRFFRCGELYGFRLGGTKQLGGCDYVTHEGLRESVGGVGAGPKAFCPKATAVIPFLSTTKLWPIAIFGTCPTFLSVSLILVPAFVSKFFTPNCMVSLPVMVTSCTVSLAWTWPRISVVERVRSENIFMNIKVRKFASKARALGPIFGI